MPAIHTECVDLSDWAKSHEVIEKVLQHHGPIHLLVNNAGIMRCPEWKTEEGFEMQFGVNHLGRHM